MTIEIVTDAGCYDNPIGMAAWAFLVVEKGVYQKLYASTMGIASNNAAELEAIIQALQWLPSGISATIITDSKYVEGTINNSWKRKANHDRWEILYDLLRESDVTIKHVHGHNGHPENSLVDAAVNYILGRSVKLVFRQEIERLLVH